jgi:hypothetical protein
VVDTEDCPLKPEEIRAQIAEAKRLKDEAQINRSTKARRTAETKQRKGRVNPALLRGQPGPGREEPWTFRARKDLIKKVKNLAADLSEPRAKVSIAMLMEEAMEMVIEKYRQKAEADA